MAVLYDVSPDPLYRLQRALRSFDKALEVSPASPGVKRGLARMSGQASRFASQVTHRDTATLYRSYVNEIGDGTSGAYSRLYVDPGVTNPRGQKPVAYAPYEFGRGGDHDAFRQTVDASGPWVEDGVEIILKDAAQKARM